MDETESTFSANSNEHDCPICLSPFTEPKILLCGHIMCRVCLLSWIRSKVIKVGCPLCRHRIFEWYVQVPEYLVDSLPTDHVMWATVRGNIDLSPETCLGQDVQNTETDTREAVKDLSDEVQVVMEKNNKLQKYVKDLEDEFHGLEDVSEFVSSYKTQTQTLRSVLSTHKHLLQRMGDSHQVVATILMRKHMQDRVEQIRRKVDFLSRSFLLGSQRVRASWIE